MFFSSAAKEEEPQPAETQPLLEEGIGEEDVPEDEQPPWDITQLVYEPVTKHYQCELNPTPLRLLLINLGIGFVEIMSILGAYMFLNTHMGVMFPKCDNYPVIDRMLGTNIGHGILCELCSIFLWTFPLICCMMVPVFHYWEFVDSRLYYECLRSKLLVKFQPREFFVSPLVIFLVFYLILGALSLIFGAPDSYREWKMKAIVMFTFLFPVVSFIATVYMKWDIKYNLISLANFVDLNTPWAREHMHNCRGATELELEAIYEEMKTKLVSLKKKTSANVFNVLYKEVKRRRDIQIAKAESHPEIKQDQGIMTSKDIERMQYDLRIAWSRVKSLVLWRDGYWLIDLMWIPEDARAIDFRFYFRIFAAGTLLLELAMVYMIVSTVMTYLHQQGWVRGRDVRDMLWLKDFIVERMTHKKF